MLASLVFSVAFFPVPVKSSTPFDISYLGNFNLQSLSYEATVPTLHLEIPPPPALPAPVVKTQPIVRPAKKTVKVPVIRQTENSPSVLEKIKQCESGGNYQAQNKHSTASGAYQFLTGSWHAYKGYKNAKDAPPEIQDEYALQYFKDNGTRPWIASKSCWRS